MVYVLARFFQYCEYKLEEREKRKEKLRRQQQQQKQQPTPTSTSTNTDLAQHRTGAADQSGVAAAIPAAAMFSAGAQQLLPTTLQTTPASKQQATAIPTAASSQKVPNSVKFLFGGLSG